MMTTVYFDSKMTDAERRGKIFAGDIFVFSPRQSTLALVDFARELIEAAFAPLPPRTAQFELSVERFVETFGPLKPHFIHHPKTAALLRDVVAELGGDLNTVRRFIPITGRSRSATDRSNSTIINTTRSAERRL
jgi:hypothetical protein